jgi:hypothetical protein
MLLREKLSLIHPLWGLWKMKHRLNGLIAAFGILALISFSAKGAAAAGYTDSFTANPGTFTCGYFSSVEICGGTTLFSAGPRMLAAGDKLTESVDFTSSFVVPPSNSSDLVYVELFDATALPGPAFVGPNTSTYSSTLRGYVGPANPLVGPFTNGYLSQYIAVSGFCCGYGVPNHGFSLTGITSNFTIDSGDPIPIYGLAYGYTVNLPASPATLASLPGGAVNDPVILPAGLVGSISNRISGASSDSQFYDFVWKGGLFQTQGTIVGADPMADFQFQLFSVGSKTPIEGVTMPLQDLTLSQANDFTALMSVLNLAAGDYEIGLYTNSPLDPQFTLNFDTPVGNAVPEPATWAMMVVGLGGLGAALRSRRGRMAASV